jgi:hypothetical protein
MSKRRDKTFAQQFDERLGTMETKLKNLASVIDEGHVPEDREQALRVASLMKDVSAELHRLGSAF